jgi:large subunit ribosomal protein L7/L12
MEKVMKDDVVQALGNMTVMELIALTKHLEEKWGLQAVPQVVQVTNVSQQETKESTQTEFTVTLVSFPADKKMALVRLVREQLALGLLESKNLVEAAPKILKDGVSKEEAEGVRAKFVEAGAVIEVK